MSDPLTYHERSPYAKEIMLYNLAAVVFSTLPNYLYQTQIKTNADLKKVVGFKFAAYSSTYVWTPLALISTLHLVKQSAGVSRWMMTAVTLSTTGPFFFNFIATYYTLLFSGTTAFSLQAIGFYIYAAT